MLVGLEGLKESQVLGQDIMYQVSGFLGTIAPFLRIVKTSLDKNGILRLKFVV